MSTVLIRTFQFQLQVSSFSPVTMGLWGFVRLLVQRDNDNGSFSFSVLKPGARNLPWRVPFVTYLVRFSFKGDQGKGGVSFPGRQGVTSETESPRHFSSEIRISFRELPFSFQFLLAFS